jgi:hypothetical protein
VAIVRSVGNKRPVSDLRMQETGVQETVVQETGVGKRLPRPRVPFSKSKYCFQIAGF